MSVNSQGPSGVATQLEHVREQLGAVQTLAIAADARAHALTMTLQWILPLLCRNSDASAGALLEQAELWDANFEHWKGALTDREEWRKAIDALAEALPKTD